MDHPDPEVTRLANLWATGDDAAFLELMEVVYPQLQAIARRQIGAAGGEQTVSATALVHEVYLKLARSDGGAWPSRAHFFAFCSTAMRHLLVDFARRRSALKRGGPTPPITLLEQDVVGQRALDFLALDHALLRLAQHNERMARIVECRFFGGLSVQETADALGASVRTVVREWSRARLYLQLELSDGDA